MAYWRHGGGIGIVGDLKNLRGTIEDRRAAFDMEGEDRGAYDHDEIIFA